ncbi:unnamed protein product [Vicia faba]|uniref:Uncharacterized protein n=1 Tax=Vicia faba TaxID=3906 RepID=A0AAV0ZJ03_VICFA|nr:unnamed protein product [Vicia faba]
MNPSSISLDSIPDVPQSTPKHNPKNLGDGEIMVWLKRLRRNENDEEVLLYSFQREHEIEGDSSIVMLLRSHRISGRFAFEADDERCRDSQSV